MLVRVRIVITSGKEEERLRKGQKEDSGVQAMFYFLTLMITTQLCTPCDHSLSYTLQSVHCVHRLYINEKFKNKMNYTLCNHIWQLSIDVMWPHNNRNKDLHFLFSQAKCTYALKMAQFSTCPCPSQCDLPASPGKRCSLIPHLPHVGWPRDFWPSAARTQQKWQHVSSRPGPEKLHVGFTLTV